MQTYRSKHNRFLELRWVIFVLVSAVVVFLNVRKIPEIVAESYFVPIAPQYGEAVRNFYINQKNTPAYDRNWYAYFLIERSFRGWTLIAPDRVNSYFSAMYNFNFGGLQSIRIESYEHDISDAEARALRQRPHWQGGVKRYGSLVIVPPAPGMSPGQVIMVRHRTMVFMAPAVYLPKRLSVTR